MCVYCVIKTARELARKNIIDSRRYNKRRLSRTSGPTFKVGDRVLLKANPQRLPFTAHYDPGYRIKAVNGPAIVIENARKKQRLVNRINLKLAPAMGKLSRGKRPRRKVVKHKN